MSPPVLPSRIRFLGPVVAALLGLVLALAPAEGTAQEIGAGKQIGVGLGWGTFAAGLTGKYYLSTRSALQAHLGSSFSVGHHDHDSGLGLSVDYVWEPSSLATAPAGRLFWGIGGGGAVFSDEGGGLAVNGVAELGWHFAPVPIELVLDYRPYLAFGSGFADFGFLFPMGFSARFYF